MPDTGTENTSRVLNCVCGERLHVPEGYSRPHARCSQCGHMVIVPQALISASTESETGTMDPIQDDDDPVEAPKCEMIASSEGKTFWKLTCFCGKRILWPVHARKQQGRCPKCSQHLKLPKNPPKAPEKPVLKEEASPVETEEALKELKKILSEDAEERERDAKASSSASQRAAAGAADKLRPPRPKITKDEQSSTFISAWPLAGRGPRTVAAFIDVTIATGFAASVALMAANRMIPPVLGQLEIVLSIFAGIGFLNDVIGQTAWNGSIGKMLVVIVIRHTSGSSLSVPNSVARALFKWLSVPLWWWGLVSNGERSVHDIIANTLVLKGRVRKSGGSHAHRS